MGVAPGLGPRISVATVPGRRKQGPAWLPPSTVAGRARLPLQAVPVGRAWPLLTAQKTAEGRHAAQPPSATQQAPTLARAASSRPARRSPSYQRRRNPFVLKGQPSNEDIDASRQRVLERPGRRREIDRIGEAIHKDVAVVVCAIALASALLILIATLVYSDPKADVPIVAAAAQVGRIQEPGACPVELHQEGIGGTAAVGALQRIGRRGKVSRAGLTRNIGVAKTVHTHTTSDIVAAAPR